MSGNEIRARFLKFFAARGHKVLPSASLVPKDPSVLLTIAGMVPFKPFFLGNIRTEARRIATSQRCLRTNDIEYVGKTLRHHTFFEMLGNFSFGDYKKAEAISWAWEFLTDELKIPKEGLWVSVYREDEEAYQVWHKRAKIPEARIVKLGDVHNFWAIGPTGPCGPCSEILIDLGKEYGCGRPTCQVGCDCDRFLELWNLVFMEYDRDSEGRLNPLPHKNIDTGMGLERLAMVLQGTPTTFETDLLKPIVDRACQISNVEYGKDRDSDLALRIIADHVRAISFLMFDGVLPSNEGRGYVLRRILRRALVQGRVLGLCEPFLHKLVPQVADIMAEACLELGEGRKDIVKVTLGEERRFLQTLDQGMRVFQDLVASLIRKGQRVIPGERTFELHDTYGLPKELTRELASEHNLSLDEAGFVRAMEEQRLRGKMAWQEIGQARIRTIYNRLAREIETTKFEGYDTHKLRARVVAIIKGDELVDFAKQGKDVDVILDRTPFYGQAGGQVGDRGVILNEGVRLDVIDAQRPVPELIVHRARVSSGAIEVGDEVEASIDLARRLGISRNHTATHLLQAALRKVLGKHVRQTGSLVAPERLRFDLTHFAPILERQLAEVEELVNEKIKEDLPVETLITSFDEAKRIGAIALFDQKYGKRVRLVKTSDFSLELCGGTHLKSTGQIGLFRLVQESGVASGVRRVEALTGKEAYEFMRSQEDVLARTAQSLKVSRAEVPEYVARLIKRTKELEREIKDLKRREFLSRRDELITRAKDIDGVKAVIAQLEGMDIRQLGNSADALKDKMRSGVIILGSVIQDKVGLVGVVTKDLTGVLHAGRIVKEVAKVVNGSGGGREGFAQAGGKKPDMLPEALKLAPRIIASQMKR